MLVKNQKIPIKWWVTNREHFVAKGYEFTKYKDVFFVNVEDLLPQSNATVEVICDYCGITIQKTYKNYLHQHDDIMGDCCCKCKTAKSTRTNMCNLGVPYPTQSKKVIEKSKQSFKEKYGAEWISKSQYWVKKVEDTNRDKRGVINVFQDEDVKEKIIQTNLKKYGTKNPMQNAEVAQKSHKHWIASSVANGSIPTSKTEQAVCTMLFDIYGRDNCYPSHPIDNVVADCVVNVGGYQIDVEYDGWYWHKNRQTQDTRRNNFVISQGYKVLRIKSNFDLPTKQQIQDAINYLINDNHNYHEIILDI